MKNKVLINVYVIALDVDYDIYVPINEDVGHICNMICKAISDLSDVNEIFKNGYCLMDTVSGACYSLDTVIKNTDIRNGKRLILFGN